MYVRRVVLVIALPINLLSHVTKLRQLVVPYVHLPKILFSHIGYRFSSGRGPFLTLSAAGHAGGPRVH